MELKEAVDEVEKSVEFINWKKDTLNGILHMDL